MTSRGIVCFRASLSSHFCSTVWRSDNKLTTFGTADGKLRDLTCPVSRLPLKLWTRVAEKETFLLTTLVNVLGILIMCKQITNLLPTGIHTVMKLKYETLYYLKKKKSRIGIGLRWTDTSRSFYRKPHLSQGGALKCIMLFICNLLYHRDLTCW